MIAAAARAALPLCSLMLLLLSACASLLPGSAAPAPTTPSTDTASLSLLLSGKSFYDVPLYAMMNDGIAQQNHLNLSFAQFNQGGGSTGQIFAGGTGDILVGGIDTVAAIGQKDKLDVTVIGTWTQRNYFRVVSRAGSEYTKLTDMQGQTISVSGAGSYSDYALRNALKQAGLQPDTDVKIAALGQPAPQLAALQTGNVQGASLNPPTIYTALNDNQVQVVYDFEKDGPNPSILFTVRTADVRKNPAPYINFMKAYVQTVQKMKADPNYAFDVSKRDWGESTSDDVLHQELKEFLTDPGVWSTDGKFTSELYENGRAMLVGSGQVAADSFPSFQQLTQNAPNF
jgi:ABC-type nitrate/sulfonate/bicarbonate transport system substrate-binding protein